MEAKEDVGLEVAAKTIAQWGERLDSFIQRELRKSHHRESVCTCRMEVLGLYVASGIINARLKRVLMSEAQMDEPDLDGMLEFWKDSLAEYAALHGAVAHG